MNHLPIFRCFLAINGSPTGHMQQLRFFTNSPTSNNCYLVAVLFCACICSEIVPLHQYCFVKEPYFLSLLRDRRRVCCLLFLSTQHLPTNTYFWSWEKVVLNMWVNCHAHRLFILHTCVYNEAYQCQLTGACCNAIAVTSSYGRLVGWPNHGPCNETNGSPRPCIILAFNSGPKNIGII